MYAGILFGFSGKNGLELGIKFAEFAKANFDQMDFNTVPVGVIPEPTAPAMIAIVCIGFLMRANGRGRPPL